MPDTDQRHLPNVATQRNFLRPNNTLPPPPGKTRNTHPPPTQTLKKGHSTKRRHDLPNQDRKTPTTTTTRIFPKYHTPNLPYLRPLTHIPPNFKKAAQQRRRRTPSLANLRHKTLTPKPATRILHCWRMLANAGHFPHHKNTNPDRLARPPALQVRIGRSRSDLFSALRCRAETAGQMGQED